MGYSCQRPSSLESHCKLIVILHNVDHFMFTFIFFRQKHIVMIVDSYGMFSKGNCFTASVGNAEHENLV